MVVVGVVHTSCASLKSSVMDTISQAAKKSPTRAPPPSRSSRLPRPKTVCSEPAPSNKATAGPKKNATPKRALPGVECDLRERS